MWIIIVIIPLLILCWFFLAPIELHIDTRIPQATVKWISIGKAIIVFEKEKWFLQLKILFFYKQWDLERPLFVKKEKKKTVRRVQKKRKPDKAKWGRKFFNVAKTFQVIKWRIAIDTGDSIKNAWLYPLNFFPRSPQHIFINFIDENYFLLTVRNTPWKLIYGFLK